MSSLVKTSQLSRDREAGKANDYTTFPSAELSGVALRVHIKALQASEGNQPELLPMETLTYLV